ncbi:TPA: hypothetical protein ACH3X3_014430 [Trebouxia sp. C0006]
MTVLLYGGATRSSLDKHLNPLSIAHMWCSRQICGTSMRDHITNQYILMRCEPLSVKSQSEARGLDGLLITAGCLTAGHASGRRAELPALMGRMCIGFDSCLSGTIVTACKHGFRGCAPPASVLTDGGDRLQS